jgi:hypothetical protein
LSFVVNCGRATGPEKPANGVFLVVSKPDARGNTTQYIDGHDGTTYTLLTTENLQALEWTTTEAKGAKEGTGFLWHDAETPARKLNSWLDAALPWSAALTPRASTPAAFSTTSSRRSAVPASSCALPSARP